MWDFLVSMVAILVLAGIAMAIWEALKPDPRYPVNLPPPLREPDTPFDRTLFPTLDRPLPQFNENALQGVMQLEFIKKADELDAHLAYLGEAKTKIDSYLSGRIADYSAARSHLVQQRKALRITLKHAKKLTEGLSSASVQRHDIQLPRPIPVPAAPLYETPEQMARKFTAISNVVGANGYRAVQNGGALGGAALLLAATAATIITFSRSVRKLVESDREMKLYLQRAGDNVEILGASYRELVATSREIFQRDQSLRGMISTIETPGVLTRYREGSAAPAETGIVATLIAHSRIADGYVGMGD